MALFSADGGRFRPAAWAGCKISVDWLSLQRAHAIFPFVGWRLNTSEEFPFLCWQELFISIQAEANTNYKYLSFARRRLPGQVGDSGKRELRLSCCPSILFRKPLTWKVFSCVYTYSGTSIIRKTRIYPPRTSLIWLAVHCHFFHPLPQKQLLIPWWCTKVWCSKERAIYAYTCCMRAAIIYESVEYICAYLVTWSSVQFETRKAWTWYKSHDTSSMYLYVTLAF